ncbi:MAG TPA: dihydroorotate dehydrogenase electron transfer subunit [Deltaproteobacteria bacterium]|nr:dihydroorotate dehydrogenase electron transfer subunit [Deltaproteobacteria bacterium]
MTKNIYIGEILKNEEVAQDVFQINVALHAAFGKPQPGQFVMLRISGLSEPFLSRPFSVYSFALKKNSCEVGLIYRVVGKGTRILAGLIRGTQVEIIGPLGRGFEILRDKENIVLVAGGMGVAPLSFLAQNLRTYLPSSRIYFYLGAQNAAGIIGVEGLEKSSCSMSLCTDDGSIGKKGLVTQVFQEQIKSFSPDSTVIYACGPKEMLKGLAKIIRGTEFACQVSLEERMACGVGACLGCAVAVKNKKSSVTYKRVCADGPVFNIREIVWK